MRFTYSYRKMAKLFANSGDPDQKPHSAASDLGCTVCQLAFYRSPDYNGLKCDEMHQKSVSCHPCLAQ